jgi:ubiquitin C-terminal hydrolase
MQVNQSRIDPKHSQDLQKQVNQSHKDSKYSENRQKQVHQAPKGIKNTKSNCYMSSVIQCLAANQDFINSILQRDLSTSMFEFKALLEDIRSNRTNYSIINKFKAEIAQNYPEYRSHQSRDAMKFLSHLLTELDKVCRDIIDATFRLRYETHSTCQTCKDVSIVKESSKILTLPIPNDKSSIRKCLEHFIGRQELMNQEYCMNCTKSDIVVMRQSFNSPSILVIHLYRYTRQQVKLEHSVRPDLEIRLGDCKYMLYGICCHIGNLEAGHFFSYVRIQENWYLCNDTEIIPLRNIMTQVSGKDTYMCFYRKAE